MLANSLITVALILAGLPAGTIARAAQTAQRHPGSGLAISIDRSKQSIVVSHESIPGYMDAMVMPFYVKDAASLNGLAPGVKVEFTLVVDKGSSWIEQLHKVEFRRTERDPEQARRLGVIESIIGKSTANQVTVGQKVPDFTLPDQNNHATSLAQF